MNIIGYTHQIIIDISLSLDTGLSIMGETSETTFKDYVKSIISRNS